MTRSILLRVVAFMTTITAAENALACAVCFSAKNEASRLAFIITTAGLTILPLLFIAWGVWWVVRRERELEPSDDAARATMSTFRSVDAPISTPLP